MRKALIILIVLFGVFLAIGCAEKEAPNETVVKETKETKETVVKETPVQAVTPAEQVTRTTIRDNNTTVNRTTIQGNNTTVARTTIKGNNTTATRTTVVK